MKTQISNEDGTLTVSNAGDMVIIIPASEKDNQLQWLAILEPETTEQYDEVTALMDKVTGVKPKPKLTVVKGDKK